MAVTDRFSAGFTEKSMFGAGFLRAKRTDTCLAVPTDFTAAKMTMPCQMLRTKTPAAGMTDFCTVLTENPAVNWAKTGAVKTEFPAAEAANP